MSDSGFVISHDPALLSQGWAPLVLIDPQVGLTHNDIGRAYNVMMRRIGGRHDARPQKSLMP